ncbi:MAG: asparaginase, partial [Alphaproteobacteria bacterium]|nr:asparaginase [Alphaproteobacteria bacterium]
LHYPRQKAIHSILAAIVQYPELIAGENAFDTKVIKLTQGSVICKGGAGGFQIGIIPSHGLGIALKIDDGNLKAAELAFLAVLRSLGAIDDELYEKLEPRFPITSHKGKTVGFLHPTIFTTLPTQTGHH